MKAALLSKIYSLALLFACGSTAFSVPASLSLAQEGGVFISNEPAEGPVFYPASYDSSLEGEPQYSWQNTNTFSCMNFGSVSERYRGDSVKVAVIDSGLNYDHEDFKINGNRIIQPVSRSIEYSSSSWLYYEFSNNPSHLNDSLGHGTNVASVIASQINAVGCAGIAPNVELYVYRVTNANNGYEFTAISNALQYCIDNKVDVINMSFQAYEHAVSYGGSSMGASTGCSTILSSAINKCYNAGITLVGAAGNFNTSEPSYPASNNHVISVGSLAKASTSTKAGYSNTYGIDLVAPGSVYVANKGNSNAYTETQGTSFSAPIVTAAIALYKQKYPLATNAEIEAALYESCSPIAGNPAWAGHGRLNIEAFLGDEPDGPTGIEITNVDEGEMELHIGDSFPLEWEVEGRGEFSDEVTFELLEDNGTISVDANGVITANGFGADFVSVTSVQDPTITADVYVSVVPSRQVVVGEKTTIVTGSWSTNANFSGSGYASYTTSGYTNVESQSLRLGSGSNTGTLTIALTKQYTSLEISVTAKSYGSDTSVNLSVAGQSKVITSSYETYTWQIASASSIAIATTAKNKRAHISNVSISAGSETDISDSATCEALEQFIAANLHMKDYTSNLGYCRDNEHHYYTTAKASFNALDAECRELFLSHDAYEPERNRLCAWAEANGEMVTQQNTFGHAKLSEPQNDTKSKNTYVLLGISLVFLVSVSIGILALRRRSHD